MTLDTDSQAKESINMSNPIEQSIDYLVECGWDKEQARNLVAAITDEDGRDIDEIMDDPRHGQAEPINRGDY